MSSFWVLYHFFRSNSAYKCSGKIQGFFFQKAYTPWEMIQIFLSRVLSSYHKWGSDFYAFFFFFWHFFEFLFQDTYLRTFRQGWSLLQIAWLMALRLTALAWTVVKRTSVRHPCGSYVYIYGNMLVCFSVTQNASYCNIFKAF